MNERIKKLLDKMRQVDLDALLVTGEINVRYLTGFTGDSTYLVITQEAPILLSDGRYESQIASQCPGFVGCFPRRSERATACCAAHVSALRRPASWLASLPQCKSAIDKLYF